MDWLGDHAGQIHVALYTVSHRKKAITSVFLAVLRYYLTIRENLAACLQNVNRKVAKRIRSYRGFSWHSLNL